MPIVTDLFRIKDIPAINGCEWSVDWPGWGQVRTPATQAKLLNLAFDTRAMNIGIAFEGRFGRVLFLQGNAWAREKAEDIVRYYEMDGITALAFPERSQAEQFVEAAEKVIVWRLLNRENHD